MSNDKKGIDDLPELPDVAELQELPELPDLPEESELAELPDLPELPGELPSLPEESIAASSAKVERAVAPEPVAKPERPHDPIGDLTSEMVHAVDRVAAAVEPHHHAHQDPTPPDPKPEVNPVSPPEVKPTPSPEVKPTSPPEVRPTPSPEVTPTPSPEVTPPAHDALGDLTADVVEVIDDMASAANPEPASESTAALGPDGKPPLRTLDKSQTHMKLAAKIVLAGSLLPFMQASNISGEGNVWFTVGGKLLVLAAAWLWGKQVLHNWSPTLSGGLGKLADLSLKPKAKEEDPKKAARRQKQKVATIEHPFPTGLHVVSILLVIGGFALSLNDPRSSFLGPVGPAETGMLAWSAFTIVHLLAYERWGSFNPLFPLMFLAMLFSGFASVVAGLGAEMPWKAFNLLGGLVVGAGGGFAAFTIVEAMIQAKKEGDIKKAAAIEARKAARKSKK